jgi:hypothetical protein
MEPTQQPEPTGADRSSPAPRAGQGGAKQIDIRKLADKVYRLMLADIRLEQARGARSRQHKE